MNTKHLKARILDLALQGKLVENSRIPNDLNSRIPSDFNPPFKIPNSWQWVKLGDICEIIRGGSPRPIKEFLTTKNNGLNWIKISDSDIGGKYIISAKEKIIKEGLSKTRFIKSGSLLLTNSMSFGRPYILKIDGCIHDGWLVLNNFEKFAYINFLYFLISSDFIQKSFRFSASGSTVNNLTTDKVKTTYIPLPPKDEQERIVKKIDELFSQIDILETSKQSLLKNIKHTKTRILDLALQGKLVENSRIPTDLNSRIPSDFNPPFKIPNSWAWVKLGDICEISSGGTPSRNEAQFWENGTIPWLKIADIKDDYVNSSSEFITQKGLENSSAKIFKKGTLLFTIFATLGEVAILNIDASTNQAIVGLTPKKDNYITKFIFFALKNIKNSVKLIGRGATQKNINQTILKNFYIPLPPLDEQERIVKKIDELFEILEVIENSL